MDRRPQALSGLIAKWAGMSAVAGGLALLLAGTASATPALAACSPSITACGCVITRPGTYVVANDLDASQTSRSVCIEIAASRAILNVKGNAIIGAGKGIGILVTRHADHVLVAGGDESPTPPLPDDGMNGDPFPGTQAVVANWNVGIQVEGDHAVITLFRDIGGTIFQQDQGNRTAGILFRGAKNGVVGDFHASYNGKAGIIARQSSGIRVFNFSAIGNGESGVWLDRSHASVISTGSAAGNGKYGMWLLDSSRNLIVNCNGTTANGDTGILLGCGDGWCPYYGGGSDENVITNSGAPGNTAAGIVIERHNRRNTVTVTHNEGNPANRDMVDENPDCDANTWYNNVGQGNQGCVK